MARRDLSIRPSEKYLQPFIDEFIKKNGGKKWTLWIMGYMNSTKTEQVEKFQ